MPSVDGDVGGGRILVYYLSSFVTQFELPRSHCGAQL